MRSFFHQKKVLVVPLYSIGTIDRTGRIFASTTYLGKRFRELHIPG